MARLIVGNTLFYKITFYHPYTKDVFDPDLNSISAEIVDTETNTILETIPITIHDKTIDGSNRNIKGVYLYSYTPTKKGTFLMRIKSKLEGLSSIEESTFTIS